MFLHVLSVVGPILYWMGAIQGDRRMDELDRWDGTLTSLVVPPNILYRNQLSRFEPHTLPSSVGRASPLEYAPEPSYTILTPQSSDITPTLSYPRRFSTLHGSSMPAFIYFGFLTGTALAVRTWTVTKYSTLVSALQKTLQEYYRRIETLRSENEKLKYNEEGKTQTIQSLPGENKSLNDLLREEHLRTQDLEGDKKSLKNTLQEKEQSIENLEGEKKLLKDEIQGKIAKIKTLEDGKVDSEEGMRERDAKIISLKDEKAGLESSSREKDADIQALKDEKAGLESSSREKDADIQALKDEKAELERSSQEKGTKIQTLEHEKVDLEELCQEKDKSIGDLEDEKAELERSSQEKDINIQTLEKEKMESERLSREKDARIKALQDGNANLDADVQQRDEKINTLETEKEKSRTDLQDKDNELKGLRGQLEKSNSELNGLRTEVLAMKKGQDQDKSTVEGTATNDKGGGYSLKGTDLHDATLVAGEVFKKIPVPARPPTPEKKATPMANPLPSKPTFTGIPTPSQSNKKPKPSPFSDPFSSPGADLLPSLLTRPKGSVPPLLPPHQPFGAGQSSSHGPANQPLSPLPGIPVFNPQLTGTMPGHNLPGLGALSASTPTTFGPSSSGVANAPSTSNRPLFNNDAYQEFNAFKTPIRTGPFSGFAPSTPSAAKASPTPGPLPLGINHQSGAIPLQRAVSEATKPIAGKSMQDEKPTAGPTLPFKPRPLPKRRVNPQSGAMPLQQAVSEATNPMADQNKEEEKPTAGPSLPFKPMPMPRRRFKVSKPWPHARQTDGDPSWQTCESVSWPHGRQINGRPCWR